jgi:uncharacterized protein (TIGR00251 family)
MTRVEAVVTPNSREFAVQFDSASKTLKVRLTEPAERGKANLELVRRLSELLGTEVVILRGHSSRRKLLQVGLDESGIARALAAEKEG